MQKTVKKVHIKTWGCQMNVYDSVRIADVIRSLGYTETSDVGEADLIILNTCHIREKATEKLFSELGRLREVQMLRRCQGKNTIIGVAGCVAQAQGEGIQARAPFVDMVFGPQTYHQLPKMIEAIEERQVPILNTEFPAEAKFDFLPKPDEFPGISAYLTVQEGCDRFCTYCVVPYTRGAEYSRRPDDVLSEARSLVDMGAREITLLGQNVNAYQEAGISLAQLLRSLAEIPDLQRLRYTTSHPSDMTEDLIAIHGQEPKLMPFLHLPVQSGSNAVLEAMNRKHTRDDYFKLIEKLRLARPDIALSSDFIVGFPGETEEDFEQTMDLVRHVRYAQAYSFKYSRRPGTPAASLPNQVEEEVKDDRLQRLQALLRRQQKAFNKNCIGRTLPVLFENLSEKEGHVFGKTPYLQTVHAVGGQELVGKIVEMTITEATLGSVSGILSKTPLTGHAA